MNALTSQHRPYNTLKDIAIRDEPQPTPNFLNELKSAFANQIVSPRRYECIRTPADLIDYLERRDVVNEYNVEVLRLLGKKELDEAIDNYMPPLEAPSERADINEYHEMNIASEMSNKILINGHNIKSHNHQSTPNGKLSNHTPTNALNYADQSNNVSSTNFTANSRASTARPASTSSTSTLALTEEKRASIYKMLSQHLGTNWRSFGRELGIRESAMDEIELQCPRDLTTRVYKLLKAFEEDDAHEPKMHLRIIKEALERARRKDLRRKIDNIMSH